MKRKSNTHPPGLWACAWLALLLWLAVVPRLSAQTTLGTGDLAFVGYNASDDQLNGANSNEQFSFVLLKDVSSGTKIYFTDYGWLTGDGFQKKWVAGPENGGSGTGSKDDGILSWTATSDLAAGTQVVIRPKYLMGASTGTVAGEEAVSGQAYFMNLSDIAGDQLFAYQAPSARAASPMLLAGLMILEAWSPSLSNSEYTPSGSTLPAALTAGGINAALNIYSTVFELNFRALSIYDCNLNIGFPRSLRNAINTFSDDNALSAWNIPFEGTACEGYLYQPDPGQDCYQPGIPAAFDLPIPCVFTVLQVRILTQPENREICPEEEATFSATAENAQTYRWQGMPPGGSWSNLVEGSVYTGVLSTTLKVLEPAGLNGWQYRMLAEEPIEPSSVPSNPATLTVKDSPQGVSLTASGPLTCTTTSVELTAASTTAGTTFTFSGPNGPISAPADATSIEVDEEGEYTVTATAPNNCSASASTTVLKEGGEPAFTADTPAEGTLFPRSTGNVGCFYEAVGTEFDAFTDDTCPVLSLTYVLSGDTPVPADPSNTSLAGVAFNLGTTLVTWTAESESGHTISRSFSVTVADDVKPEVLTQDFTVQLDASGQASITVADIDAGSSDNCAIAADGYSLDITDFSCANLGTPVTVTLSVTDASGNTASNSAEVTVEDNMAPTAECRNIEVILDQAGTVSITVADIDNGSTDNCAIQSRELLPTSFSSSDVGPNPVVLTLTDNSGNQASCEATVTVSRRPTELVYSMEFSKQYSDEAGLQARLTDQLSGLPLEGKTINFILGTQSISAITDGNGDAVASLRIDQEPGSYMVEVGFAGDAIYLESADSAPFAIHQEDAKATYTGPLFASTSGSNSSSASLILSTTLQDITAVPGDPAYDVYEGDILKASLRFRIIETGEVIPATLAYVNAADKKTAIATANWTADIGSADSRQYTVDVLIGAYYKGSASSEDLVVVTVSRPLNDFVTGGGFILPTNSAGEKAGDAGRKNNFGFNLKYNKKGTNLQGNINILVRHTEADGIVHVYQIKGNSMTSLSVQPVDESTATAVFYGKASIQDVTDPDNPISVDGNASLQVNMTDRGEPGSSDDIGITVWDKNGGLWYSSNWDGVQTSLLFLSGGNLVIRGGATAAAGSANTEVGSLFINSSEPPAFRFYNYPNTFSSKTTIAFVLDKEETYALEVYDLNGRRIKSLISGTTETGKLHEFELDASDMAAGVFVTRLITPTRTFHLRIVKTH